jgi:hypothetical protein
VLRCRSIRLWAAVGAFALLAAGCADGDSDGGTPVTSTTAAPTVTSTTNAPDVCDVPLAATEIGIDEDEITIFVMADATSTIERDLFQGSIDAVKAWGNAVNDRGGLACRKVVVREWDSRLTPDDTTAGTVAACDDAFAMVGTTSLVLLDATTIATCPDKAGRPTGVPDIAQLATELPHQCNATTFPINAPKADCPYGGGPRVSTQFVGASRYYLQLVPGLHGVSLVPSDLPSVQQSSIAVVRAQEAIGVGNDGELTVSDRDEQATFARFAQPIKEKAATYVFNGANAAAMIKMRKEAVAQGVSTVSVWACQLSCYTRQFLDDGGDDVEGTYLWLQFLPFEEADTNPELRAYLDAVGGIDDATPWGAAAWAAAVEFQQVVDGIVEADGPNALTRARFLTELAAIDRFDANGWFGAKGQRQLSDCFVLLQVKNGAFARVFPEQRGTFDCDQQNLQAVSVDPVAATPG